MNLLISLNSSIVKSANIIANNNSKDTFNAAIIELIGVMVSSALTVIITLVLSFIQLNKAKKRTDKSLKTASKNTKEEISNYSHSTQKKIKNSNDILNKKLKESRRDFYNNSLYLYNHKRLDKTITYIIKIFTDVTIINNYIKQILDLLNYGVKLDNRYSRSLQKLVWNKLREFMYKRLYPLDTYILSWGEIEDSMSSMRSITGLPDEYSNSNISKLFVQLNGLKIDLQNKLDYIKVDKLYHKSIKPKDLKTIRNINLKIKDTCEKIFNPLDKVINFYPYRNYKNDAKRMVHHINH